MKKKKNLNYKDCNIGSATRRLGSVGLDALFIIVVSIIGFFSYYGIANNVDGYKIPQQTAKEERINCYKVQEEAKLYVFEGDEETKYNNPMSFDKQFNNYCLRQILLTQSKNPAEFEDFDVTIKNPDKLEPANYENDELAYFYSSYVKQYNNFNGKNNDIMNVPEGISYKQLFKKQYKENATSGTEMFNDFDITNDSYPYLKVDSAIKLYKYINDSSKTEGESIYTSLKNNYYALWKIEVNQLQGSSRFMNHYNLYVENYSKTSFILDGGIVAGYILAFFTMIILPQIIFGYGKTFGKKITCLAVLNDDGSQMKILRSFGRNSCVFILYFSFMIITCFFLGNVTTAFLYPIFNIGTLGVSLFHISFVILFISLISFIVVIATRDKKSLHDFMFKTLVINDKYAYEEDDSETLNSDQGGENYEVIEQMD